MGVSPRLFPRFHRGYMAHKGGMDTFDARNHLDKDDPGMPQFLRSLNERKKKAKKKETKIRDTEGKIVNPDASDRAMELHKKLTGAAFSSRSDFVK